MSPNNFLFESPKCGFICQLSLHLGRYSDFSFPFFSCYMRQADFMCFLPPLLGFFFLIYRSIRVKFSNFSNQTQESVKTSHCFFLLKSQVQKLHIFQCLKNFSFLFNLRSFRNFQSKVKFFNFSLVRYVAVRKFWSAKTQRMIFFFQVGSHFFHSFQREVAPPYQPEIFFLLSSKY